MFVLQWFPLNYIRVELFTEVTYTPLLLLDVLHPCFNLVELASTEVLCYTVVSLLAVLLALSLVFTVFVVVDSVFITDLDSTELLQLWVFLPWVPQYTEI